ncbi:Kinesin motor domain [Carpediemonas membranifera]|uniref:Kinesin motor domain n=1 Tax=Carpediemonas membranifera TaxID=201153 RepID=A0A8J6E4K5_9EUKA|nr:Kinesin motor domain [Carpediemonas membranifera]|eukprot:KAG9397061.1 Kinesin motor domain [Carpediemonas membranifera]
MSAVRRCLPLNIVALLLILVGIVVAVHDLDLPSASDDNWCLGQAVLMDTRFVLASEPCVSKKIYTYIQEGMAWQLHTPVTFNLFAHTPIDPGAAMAATEDWLAVLDTAGSIIFIFSRSGFDFASEKSIGQAADSIAMFNDKIAVGDITGNEAIVYQYDSTSSAWPSSGTTINGQSGSTTFGTSVAISDTVLVVGEPSFEHATGNFYGSVVLYYSGGSTVASSWTQQKIITTNGEATPPVAPSVTEYFGCSVAIDAANHIAIGQYEAASGRGAVHVGTYSGSFSWTWTVYSDATWGSSAQVGINGVSISWPAVVAAGHSVVGQVDMSDESMSMISSTTTEVSVYTAAAAIVVGHPTLPASPAVEIEVFKPSCPAGEEAASALSSTCDSCSPPYYSTGGELFCEHAQAGHFSSTIYGQNPCMPGSYQPNTGQTACIQADPGYFAVAGSVTQSVCHKGGYSTSSSQASCSDTLPGYYAAEDGLPHTVPTPCPSGTYQFDPRASECLKANAGNIPNAAADGVEPCYNGEYQPNAGQASCLVTPPGTFTTSIAAPNLAPVSCSTLGPGKYQDRPGQSGCRMADPGFFTDPTYADLTQQFECPDGRYQTMPGQTACLTPVAGTYAPDKAAMPVDCNNGKYCSAPGQVAPTVADPGFYVPSSGANDAQMSCADGRYSGAGEPGCTMADSGYYVPDSDRSHQRPCNSGKYQPNMGQSACITASPGFYVPAMGARIIQTPCDPGYYSGAGATRCVKSDEGYYVDESRSRQLPCHGGYYSSVTGGGQTACTLTDPGYYTAKDSRPHTAQDECGPGTYSAGGQSRCTKASVGHYVANDDRSKQVRCDMAGRYQDDTGQTSCKTTAAGFYTPATLLVAQLPCPSGTVSAAMAGSCTPASAGTVPSSDSSQEELCGGGFYQPSPGQTECLHCPAGSTTASDGQPHSTCDFDLGPDTVLKLAGHAETGTSGWRAVTGREGSVLVPVGSGVIPAGSYSVMLATTGGAAARTVTVVADIAVPEPELHVGSTGFIGVAAGFACPETMAVASTSVGLDSIAEADSGVVCTSSPVALTAAALLATAPPVLSGLTVSLTGAVVDSTTPFVAYLDGVRATLTATDGVLVVAAAPTAAADEAGAVEATSDLSVSLFVQGEPVLLATPAGDTSILSTVLTVLGVIAATVAGLGLVIGCGTMAVAVGGTGATVVSLFTMMAVDDGKRAVVVDAEGDDAPDTIQEVAIEHPIEKPPVRVPLDLPPTPGTHGPGPVLPRLPVGLGLNNTALE